MTSSKKEAIEAEVLAQAGVRAEPAAMDKLGGAIKMVTNMLSRDNTPVRIEAAGALLAAFGEVAAPTIPAQVPAAEVRAQALADAEEAADDAYLNAQCSIERGEFSQPIRQTREAITAAIRNLAQSSTADKASEVRAAEWISVEDRLPDLHVTVALLDENRWMNTGSSDHSVNWHGAGYLCEFGQKYWSIFGEMRSQCMEAVTHWMPLPAAPSTADSGNTSALGERAE